MLNVSHVCGYKKDFEFLCPQCNLPFCEEDMDQAIGGLLLNSVLTKITSDEAKRIADLLQIEVTTHKNKINEIIAWSNNLPQPFKSNIILL